MPDAITGPGGFAPVAAPPQAQDAFSGMDSNAFLRLLVAQMRYQNPMEPTDASAMLAQTTQLRSVESMNQVVQSQQQMLGMQQASMAAALVGKQVSAFDTAGEAVQGVVDGVRFTASGPVLLVGERLVPLDATVEISVPTPPVPAPVPPADPTPVP